jgi:lipopolysaccharide transport system permease protein
MIVAHSMRVIIEPGLSVKNYWHDLWRYRELMYFLTWRDVAVRYKQTAIGLAWVLLRPAVTMLVFVVFRRIFGIESRGRSEAVLVLAGVVPWQFFSTALAGSADSLVGNSSLISKVYFPRLLIPSAAIVTAFVDLLVTMGLLVALMFWSGVVPGWQLLMLPLFVLLAAGFSLGFGLMLAALNVEYRDFRFLVPFIVQFGLFISPVAYTIADVPESWRRLYALNPLVGIIEGFRWCILGAPRSLDAYTVVSSFLVTASTLLLGTWYFRRMERTFADVI